MTLHGHPRTLILALIESAFGTSYWSSITLVLSCQVSEILELSVTGTEQTCHFFRATPLFRPKFRGVLLGVDP